MYLKFFMLQSPLLHCRDLTPLDITGYLIGNMNRLHSRLAAAAGEVYSSTTPILRSCFPEYPCSLLYDFLINPGFAMFD